MFFTNCAECSLNYTYTIRPLPNTNMYIPCQTGQQIQLFPPPPNALLSHGQQIFYSIKYVIELSYLYSSISNRISNLITCCWFGSNCLLVSTKYRKHKFDCQTQIWKNQLLLSISIYLFNFRNS